VLGTMSDEGVLHVCAGRSSVGAGGVTRQSSGGLAHLHGAVGSPLQSLQDKVVLQVSP
jgi:hypothetical protein